MLHSVDMGASLHWNQWFSSHQNSSIALKLSSFKKNSCSLVSIPTIFCLLASPLSILDTNSAACLVEVEVDCTESGLLLGNDGDDASLKSSTEPSEDGGGPAKRAAIAFSSGPCSCVDILLLLMVMVHFFSSSSSSAIYLRLQLLSSNS